MAAYSSNLPSSLGPSSLQNELANSNRRASCNKQSEQNRQHYDILPTSSQNYMNVLEVRRMELVAHIRKSIMREEALECMVLIDVLQRLGIDYHFREEIEFVLAQHFDDISTAKNCDLLSTALIFRLMRQHGHHVPADIFNKFKDKEGVLQIQADEDIRGPLAMYEACHLGVQGEDILYELGSFSKKLLLQTLWVPSSTSKQVSHTLSHPFHKSLPRLRLKQYLQNTEGQVQGSGELLHELAKIDFNVTQFLHRQEITEISVWWSELNLSEELGFARDKTVEWFMCSLALLSDSRLSNYRIALTKSIGFIYIIDDIYDVYGTLDQLTAFTQAVKGWDANKMDNLPQCMKKSFVALSDVLDEVADMISREHGWNPIFTLRKLWEDLSDAFMEEARWFKSNHLPKSDDYLRNGIISTGVPLSLAHVCLMLGGDTPQSTIDLVHGSRGLFSSAAAILRLTDDLDTTMNRSHEGHDGCYVEYYMKEKEGASLESALEHVKCMITNEWRNINKECLSGKLSQEVREATLNLVRMAEWLHPYEDNEHHGVTKEELNSLLNESIPL